MRESDSSFRLADALDGLELGFLALDREWRVLFLNQKAAALLQLEAKSAPGGELWSLVPSLRGTRHEASWRRALEEGVPATLELDSQRITATPWAGGLTVVWTDESALRQRTDELEQARRAAENEKLRLQAVMEALPVGVAITDAQGGRVRSNAAFDELWRGAPATRNVSDYALYRAWWAESGRPLAPGEWASALAVEKGEVVVGQFLEIERFDGSRAAVLNSAAPVRDAEGRVVGSAVALQDVTELRRAQQALREKEAVLQEANARLAQTDQRKNEFLAVLSHELRNPLAPIRISTQVLTRADPGSEQAQRALAVIDRQGAQLTRLVDDLLDVTRIARNRIELQLRRVELDGLVRQAVEDQRPLFEEAGVTLELEPALAPLALQGDSNRLAQIVGNLLQNAAKFTPHGGRTRVALQADLAGRLVFLRVADTGVGMTPAMVARLFHPFAQADATLERSKGGLGLGLALVKALVELHGGVVTAHSAGPGKGSEFVVQLPLTMEEPVAHRPDRPPARGTPARVLIIEDNVDAADSLREALEFSDHQVAVANDGRRGLELAREFRPEVVLCDLGLPGIDGYEVARRFRADPSLRGTHLVALSGYALPADVGRAKDAGFDRHLAKPPELEELEALLQERPRPAR